MFLEASAYSVHHGREFALVRAQAFLVSAMAAVTAARTELRFSLWREEAMPGDRELYRDLLKLRKHIEDHVVRVDGAIRKGQPREQ